MLSIIAAKTTIKRTVPCRFAATLIMLCLKLDGQECDNEQYRC